MLRPDGSIDIPQHYLNSQASNCSILFLHKNSNDYQSNWFTSQIAVTFQRARHYVTFVSFGRRISPRECQLPINYCGSWIPGSICGYFRGTMSCCRSLWMVLNATVLLPNPYPDLIFLDIDEIVLPLLSWFTNSKIIYIRHLWDIKDDEYFHNQLTVTPGILGYKAIQFANAILVESDCAKKIVERSYPTYRGELLVMYPSYDEKLRTTELIRLNQILPDVQNLPTRFIFVAFANYKDRISLNLILDALYCLQYLDHDIIPNIHVVMVNYSRKESSDEIAYCNYIAEKVSKQCFSKQLTLLASIRTSFRKTLIEKSTAVLVPKHNELETRAVLEAMSLGKPVIGTNSGICQDILLHNVSGLLLQPDPMEFAKNMIRLCVDPKLRDYLGSMALSQFLGHYSYERYSRNLENLLWKTRILS